MCPAYASQVLSASNRAARQAKSADSFQSLIRPRPRVAQSWGARRSQQERPIHVLVSEREPPWAMTFDLRERETEWTQENKARLVTLFASHELGCDIEGVQERMQDLVQVLPDLSKKVHHMKPGLLAALLRDTHVVAERAVRLKELLPHTNVSAMAAKQPELLLQEADAIILQVKQLRTQLGSDKIDKIVEEYPSLLDAELVQETLDELSRLMPKSDPKQTLLSNPSWVTKVERGPKRLGPHPDS